MKAKRGPTHRQKQLMHSATVAFLFLYFLRRRRRGGSVTKVAIVLIHAPREGADMMNDQDE
eukprot:scaffold20941_cov76-Skeletonema_dohrnii-CCMP3373.AAC.2